MKTPSKSFRNLHQEFTKHLAVSSDGLLQAGKTLVKMLEVEPNTFEILVKEDGISLAFLESLERIGMGKLHPRILTDNSHAARRALAECLNIDDQQKLLTTGVDVVVRARDGSVHIERKTLREINSAEAPIVIADKKIQPPEAQIVAIRQREEKRALKDVRYELDGDGVIFHAGTRLSWSELMELANKVKPRPEQLQSDLQKNQIAKRSFSSLSEACAALAQ